MKGKPARLQLLKKTCLLSSHNLPAAQMQAIHHSSQAINHSRQLCFQHGH
jgi:hypothetical protein